MRLEVECKICSQVMTLQSDAKSRRDLASQWGADFSVNCPHCNNQQQINIYQVCAVSTKQDFRLPSTLAGALAGMIAGPLGMIIGASAGYGTSSQYGSSDKELVKKFNNSKV